jgi:hypothetical protein
MSDVNYTPQTRSGAYDDPNYVTRQTIEFVTAAGSGGVSAKYVAFANYQAYTLHCLTQAIGSSTYTFTQGGTTTVAVKCDEVSLIAVYNTAATGSTIALATSSWGPFVPAGNFLTSGTLTNQNGAYTPLALSSSTGGVNIPQGSQIYIVGGTDATAVYEVTLDYQVVPGAAMTA